MNHSFFKISLTTLAIITIPYFGMAQKTGKGDDDNQIEKYQKLFPSSAGVILNHKQTVNISVNKTGELDIYETDYEEILYINESCKYYNDQSITTSDFFEDITAISAMVIRPNGKKIKLKKDAYRKIDAARDSWVFHDENKEIYFDLGDIEIGTKTIISYTRKIKIPEFFDVFHFISSFPGYNSEIDITYPANMDLAFYEQSFEKFDIKKTETIGKKGMKNIQWKLNEVPGYRVEDGAISTRYTIPHVVAQIKSYEFNGTTKEVIPDIKGLHNYFQDFLLAKGDESNRSELNSIVRKVIKDKETQKEKMDTIFNWVQDNIKYIAFEDGINGYVPRSCSQVMKNRFGDCKDMGNLLVEMLTFAGVEGAYVAWVGTRDIPYKMGDIPVPFACNHVICVVEKPEGGYYYLDATNSEGSYYLPTEGIQSKDLLIHKGKDQFELHDIAPVEAEINYFKSIINFTFIDGDSLRGSGTDYYGGYEREDRAYYLENTDEEDRRDYVKDLALNGENKYTLNDYSIKNLTDKNQELIINYDFAASGLLIAFKNDYILNPTLFKPGVSRYNPEDHTQPRKKAHHRTVEYIFNFTVPSNYKVKEVPEAISYAHDLFTYNADFSLKDGVFSVKHRYQYKLLQITPDLFPAWNEFSRAIQLAVTQNIILEKN